MLDIETISLSNLQYASSIIFSIIRASNKSDKKGVKIKFAISK